MDECYGSFEEAGIYVHGHGEQDITCPKCSPTRRKKTQRCLSVNVDKGQWFCHHCSWKGSLRQERGLPSYIPVNPPRPKPVKTELPDDHHEAGLKYMTEVRMIPRVVLDKNGVLCGAKEIHFPYKMGSETVNIKHLKYETKQFYQESGGAQVFYGVDEINSECTVIVEGEIDKLSVEAAGFTAISVPSGAPAPGTKTYQSKFDFLQACKEKLDTCSKFILAVDNDAPGKTLEAELSRRLGVERCWRVDWPEGIKDANQSLVELGVERLKDLISKAHPYPIAGIVEVDSISLDRLYNFSKAETLSTQWYNMDRIFRLPVNMGLLTVITGVPSHGKSSFLDALAIRFSQLYGWRWAVFSPENQIEDHITKLMSIAVGKPFREGFQDIMSRAEAMSSRAWLDEHYKFIMPEEDTYSVDEILDRARAAVFRYGIKGLIVDPWNEIDHTRNGQVTETEYTNISLAKFRRFSRLNLCQVFLVAHPMKLRRNTDGSYSKLSLYDISGSAHFYNKADFGIVVSRPDWEKNEVVIDVQKCRHKFLGSRGEAKMEYIYKTGQFQEARI